MAMHTETDKINEPNPTTTEAPTDGKLNALASLLENLDEVEASEASPRAKADAVHQNRLTQVRLGMASALFVAMRAKHPPTAAHCLRVSLSCSSWAISLGLTEKDRDDLEVAALLHDVGKIGVPDHVLLKPGKLTAEEAMLMNRQRDFAAEILSGCCASQEILDIVRFVPAWFDGRRNEYELSGKDIPLGSRLLAIAEAFDSMTTDHVYRRAMSRERAVAELFEFAGTQFDPELVEQFNAFLGAKHERLSAQVMHHWLTDLDGSQADRMWKQTAPTRKTHSHAAGSLYHEQLLESMQDGIVFVDSGLRIIRWNRAAEAMTGVTSASAEQQIWDPGIVQLRDEHYKLIPTERCPVIRAIQSGAPQSQRVVIADQQGERKSVEAYVFPVNDDDNLVCGVTLILRDASSQVSLEEHVQKLNKKVIQDALTGVANRAEFDRVHAELVERHLDQGSPYSLIICDLDHFKHVNDTFGHQAGDEALVAFATTARSMCHGEDLVARYGGEEFVVLLPHCDNNTGTARAEMIREAFSAQSHAALGGKCLTASFGVTELQPGDTAETMLRRADRALLQAKNDGRNMVIQLGAGMSSEPEKTVEKRSGWLSWMKDKPGVQVLQRTLVTAVPLTLAAEKLRGFVSDQGAEITEIQENHVVLQVDGKSLGMMRRAGDRTTPFLIELTLEESKVESDRSVAGERRTLAHVVIRPKRQRDRRQRDAEDRARQLFSSLKAYLMAQEHKA